MLRPESSFIELKKFEKKDFDEFILAGDVSATNTRLAIVGSKEDKIVPLFILGFDGQKLKGITEALNETLKVAKERFDIKIEKAALAAAGPISPDKDFCKMTNAPWEIDLKKTLPETALDSIVLVNDFEAIGLGVPFLDDKNTDDLIMLSHPGNRMPEPVPKATKGILGAGTGLGASIMIFDKEKGMYLPIPSEGGHPDFAPTDKFEFELMEFIKSKVRTTTPIDNELVLSGRGIVSIYEFLMTKRLFDKNEVTDKVHFTAEKDKASVISKNSRADPACRRTLEIFAKVYAGALRGMAITLLARGGMYIAGGIAPKNIDFFTDGNFMQEFEKNYSRPDILKEIPVFAIMNYNVSLYGAANAALNFPELAIKK